jgi:hypothetical protein
VLPLVFGQASLDTDQRLNVTLRGPPNAALVLLMSEDLSSWTPILTNAPFTGTFVFEEPAAATPSMRFYRARAE